MKTLTIRQPWANLIMRGEKTIEVRSWSTEHRGRLAIHAAKHGDEEPRGAVIGTVDLVECRPLEQSDLPAAKLTQLPASRRKLWAWVLSDPIVIEPIPADGKLHLWEFDALRERQKK